MKHFKILLSSIIISNTAIAQEVQLQTFTGNDGLQFSSIIQKEISKNKKLNYFSFSNIFTEYESVNKLELDLLHLAHYNVYKGIVAVGGISINKQDIIPQIGFGYSMEKHRININIFPMLHYSLKEQEAGAGLYSLMEYTPYLKNKWDLYTMLILDTDFSFQEHLESKQYIRLGTQYNQKLLFGLGIDFEQKTKDFNFSANYGAFLGYTF